MGISEKAQVEGGFHESTEQSKKWVIAGIALRAPLKPIRTTVPVQTKEEQEAEAETEECSTTTPTSEESRIKSPLTCPPAPRKSKSSSKCSYSGVAIEFFTPPDLESVFLRHVEKAT